MAESQQKHGVIVFAPSAVSKLKGLASDHRMGKLWKVISPGKKAAAAAGPVATGGSAVAVASGSAGPSAQLPVATAATRFVEKSAAALAGRPLG